MSEEPQEAAEPVEGKVVDERDAELSKAALDAVMPSGAELVVSDPTDRHEVFVVLSKHDEAMILEEFQRRALRVMLYDFPMDGSRVIDLSIAGVFEAIDLMNRTGKCQLGVVPGAEAQRIEEIHDPEVVQAENFDDRLPPSFVRGTVWARDERTQRFHSGTALEPKFYLPKRGKNQGKVMWDSFAQTKAVNKAERNALKKFIPEPLRQTMIAQYKNDPAAIRQIQAGAGAEAVAELPAPLDDERMQELVARARAVYVQIREVSATAILPGSFNERMLLSQHSHDVMETFVERLEAKLAEVSGG